MEENKNKKNNFSDFYSNKILGKELLIATILLIIFFSLSSDAFMSWRNISNILRVLSITGVLTLGFSLIMIGGDFDLSIGSLIGLINIVGLILMDKGVSLWLAFLVMILIGVAWELINAMLVVKIKIHAFVASLAMWQIARGIIYWITGGRTIYGDYPEVLSFINQKTIGIVPVSTIIFIIAAVIIYLLANKSKFGRHLYAIGSNEKAAEYVGIDSEKRRIISYAILGVLAGIGGIMLASKLTSGPATGGESYQMAVIGSVFLGATAFKPGEINIGGSVLAVVIMAIIENGLVMFGAPFYFKYSVQGLIILAAVSFVSFSSDESGPELF